MIKMQPQSVNCIAGSSRLLLYCVLFVEFLAGGSFMAFGVTRSSPALLMMGAIVSALALLMAAGSRLSPPGEPLLEVEPEGVFISAQLGVGCEQEGYAWLHSAEVFQRASSNVLLLYPEKPDQWIELLPSDKIRKAKGNMERYGAPIVLSELELRKAGCDTINLAQLCTVINQNLIIERINSYSDPAHLTTEIAINKKASLYMTGSDASLCSEGICLRVAKRDGIWLFPYEELVRVSLMVNPSTATPSGREIVLILMYMDENYVLVGNTDGIYNPLLDCLLQLPGFNAQEYKRACRVADNKLCTCYHRATIAEGMQQEEKREKA